VRAVYGLALVALPTSAAAHDAFGDLGAFYQGLLHPLADPEQGLIIAAAAVFLACHPLGTFRPAYLALVAASIAAMTIGAAVALPVPALLMKALLALCIAIYALLPYRAGRIPVSTIAALLGVIAALSMDTGTDTRAMLLGILGGSTGIAVLTLIVWGAIDWAGEHISTYACAVAAAWIAAISLMAVVLPA
jgi:hypothetical protein